MQLKTHTPLVLLICCLHFTLAVHGKIHIIRSLTVILILLIYSTPAEDGDCDLPLLDGSMYRVIDQHFEASGSSNTSHGPEQVRLTGQGWCTNMQGFDIHDPWIQIEFGAQVRVTGIEIARVSADNFVELFEVQGCNENDGMACTNNMIILVSDDPLHTVHEM